MRQAGEGAVYFWRKYGRSHRLGLFLEIHPVTLPLKWLVFRTPLIMPLVRWILPRVEAREWLFIAAPDVKVGAAGKSAHGD